jgi:MFS transporter, SP family, sugar:H+ symporter
VICLFIPFSPRWLAEKNRHDEGQAVIARLRVREIDDPAVAAEYSEIREGVKAVQSIGEASWSELLKPGVRWRLTIGVVNQTFQQLTGINIIIYYSSIILQGMGIQDTNGYYQVGNSFVNFIATFPGMWAVERFGRKPLLVWGGLTMGVAHVLTYTFIAVNVNILSIITIYVFFISFASTWGPVSILLFFN